MTLASRSFFDLYAHRFARVAIGVPELRLADPAHNAAEIGRLHRQAVARGAAIVVFPELSLCGYSLDDLHQQDALLSACLDGLGWLLETSEAGSALLVVGAPLRVDGRLFNCAVVLSRGHVLGVVPKSYLPNYREFYEKRQFAAARDAVSDEITLLGQRVPFGTDLLFRDTDERDLALHVEVCEDVWVPVPPSTWGALAGATVLANLSASNVTVGKAEYRHALAGGQSAKTLSAYLYSGAGTGESTTDLAWDGHAMVYENGELLAESQRFSDAAQLVLADVDLDRLVQERARMSSWIDCAGDHAARLRGLREVAFTFTPPETEMRLERTVPRFPFVPAPGPQRDARCYEAHHIQVAGLVQRLRATGIDKVVIGVSGGLDSTQALLVAARAMDHLQLPRTHVLAYTLPAYATSEGTRRNAHRLMEALGVAAHEIDVRPSCDQMLADIGHPAAAGEPVYDTTYENVQAGERTSHLFRLANRHGALVVGTGDLSELALGWCTYGVGDHMSHYNVNVSVPKTLVRHLVEWVAGHGEVDEATSSVLRDILATEISPELVPADADGEVQSTEALIGPYELHDFSLYYVTRRGYRPGKVAYLATHAWGDDVPPARDERGRRVARAAAGDGYPCAEIVDRLETFLDRFFRTSQFKRSASPNGPKVGSGGSLSPRGDWRAPSDSSAAPWLAEVRATRAWLERSLGGR